MASGKSLELAAIPARTRYVMPRNTRTLDQLDRGRRWVRVRDRLGSDKAAIAWARAHGLDELGRPL